MPLAFHAAMPYHDVFIMMVDIALILISAIIDYVTIRASCLLFTAYRDAIALLKMMRGWRILIFAKMRRAPPV